MGLFATVIHGPLFMDLVEVSDFRVVRNGAQYTDPGKPITLTALPTDNRVCFPTADKGAHYV